MLTVALFTSQKYPHIILGTWQQPNIFLKKLQISLEITVRKLLDISANALYFIFMLSSKYNVEP